MVVIHGTILLMTNEHLLGKIEAANIACTRAHYAVLTEDEIQERHYRFIAI